MRAAALAINIGRMPVSLEPTESGHVEDALLRWEELHTHGREPDVESLCAEVPHLVDVVRGRIEALKRIDALLHTGRDESDTRAWRETRAIEAGVPDKFSAINETLSTVHRYELHDVLGKGGRAVVRSALDCELGRDVAVKVLRPQLRENQQAQMRLQREAQIISQLDHPGIVPIYGRGVNKDGMPFYCMRQVAGGTFRQAIEDFHQKPFASDTARRSDLLPLVRHLVNVCQTIAFVHQRGFVHRDVKPENILVGDFGATFVVDWGLAKQISELDKSDPVVDASVEGCEDDMESPEDFAITQTGASLGTPAYMSPEQAAGTASHDPVRSEIFNLGATMFTLLTGRAPYSGGTMLAVFRDARERSFTDDAQISFVGDPAFKAICLKAMSRQPLARYDSASDLAADIERVMADQPITCYPEPITRRLWRLGKHHRTLLTSSILALFVLTMSSMVGSAFVHRQRQRADANFRQAHRAVTDSFVRISDDFLMNQPEFQPLRSELLADGLEFYDHLLQSSSDPRIKWEMALACLQVGKLRRELGETDTAVELLSRAERLYEELAAAGASEPMLFVADPLQPANLPANVHRAQALRELGLTLSDARHLEEACGILRRSVDERSSAEISQAIRIILVETLLDIAKLAQSNDAAAAGEEALDEAEAQLFKGLPTADKSRIHGELLVQQSEMAQYRGNREQALEKIVEAIKVIRSGGQDADIEAQLALISAHQVAAELLIGLNRHQAVVDQFQESTALLDELTLLHPHVLSFRQLYANHCEQFSDSLAKLDRRVESVRWLSKALALYASLNQQSSTMVKKLVERYTELGVWHQSEDRINEAHDSFVAAVDLLNENAKHASAAAPAQLTFRLARSLQSIGVDRWRTGLSQKALEAFERSSALLRELSEQKPDNLEFKERLAAGVLGEAMACELLELFDEQIVRCQKAMELQKSLIQENPDFLRASVGLSMTLFVKSGGLLFLGEEQSSNKALERSRELMPADAEALYDFARDYAKQASRFGRDKLQYSQRDELQLKRYLAESMHCVRRAVALGLENPARMKRDPALLPLCGHPGFQQLIDQIDK